MTTAIHRRKRTEEDVGFQLAPMIDMTFLLLVFFMVTSTITNQQVRQDVVPPEAPSAVMPENQANRLVINIDRDGGFWFDSVRFEGGALAGVIEQRLGVNPQMRIYVRADRGVEVARIKEVMRLAAEAGAGDIIFATYRSR